MVKKIFEAIIAENFPNALKTVNSKIKKTINLRQKKYTENHTKSHYKQIDKHQC